MQHTGRPSITHQQVDSHLADVELQQPRELRVRLSAWIRANIAPAGRTYPSTSYGLKHKFSADCSTYVSNDVFKAALLLEGHSPVDPKELNWRFRIRVKEPRDVWPTGTRIAFAWPEAIGMNEQQLRNLLTCWSDVLVRDCFNKYAAQQVAHYTQTLELLLGREMTYPDTYPIDGNLKARIICEINHGGVWSGHAA